MKILYVLTIVVLLVRVAQAGMTSLVVVVTSGQTQEANAKAADKVFNDWEKSHPNLEVVETREQLEYPKSSWGTNFWTKTMITGIRIRYNLKPVVEKPNAAPIVEREVASKP